jgi:hypothetical protein
VELFENDTQKVVPPDSGKMRMMSATIRPKKIRFPRENRTSPFRNARKPQKTAGSAGRKNRTTEKNTAKTETLEA